MLRALGDDAHRYKVHSGHTLPIDSRHLFKNIHLNIIQIYLKLSRLNLDHVFDGIGLKDNMAVRSVHAKAQWTEAAFNRVSLRDVRRLPD